MPQSPDEPIFSPNLPENGEKQTQREKFKSIARNQTDILGYSILVKQLADFFKGKGAISDIDKLLPHLFGNNDDYLKHMVEQMRRIPNSDEAKKLLATAIFGEPQRRNEDGTAIVTSFSLAEPSSTTTQSKLFILRSKQEDKRFVPNIKGTDKLVRKLISDTGFLTESETAETIFQLKKGNKIVIPHPQDNSLIMEIESPIDTGSQDTKTAYSYHVQTKIKNN
jgi:hypothetical protein